MTVRAPVVTCDPPRETNGFPVAGARVAIAGLTLRFRTADGMFDETVPAKAWRTTRNGSAQGAMLLAVTSKGELQGTWEPTADHAAAGNTVTFAVSLAGGASAGAGGNVGLGMEDPAELRAGIFRSRLAVATWP